MTVICATCAVEHDDRLPEVCAICADERQWVPRSGQRWTSTDELTASGATVRIDELERGSDGRGLHGLVVDGGVGIGQRAILVQTNEGNLLWDPIGHITDDAVDAVRALGGIDVIAASHPHMFGVQTAWADAFGARVLVNEADLEWLARASDRIEPWSGSLEVLPGLTLHTFGGHFPGAAVAHWAPGSDGRGSLLAGDTIQPKPDGRSVSFMRSYPNNIPLSAGTVRRLADRAQELPHWRLYGNLPDQWVDDAHASVERSAQRHIDWVTGVYDHLC